MLCFAHSQLSLHLPPLWSEHQSACGGCAWAWGFSERGRPGGRGTPGPSLRVHSRQEGGLQRTRNRELRVRRTQLWHQLSTWRPPVRPPAQRAWCSLVRHRPPPARARRKNRNAGTQRQTQREEIQLPMLRSRAVYPQTRPSLPLGAVSTLPGSLSPPSAGRGRPCPRYTERTP